MLYNPRCASSASAIASEVILTRTAPTCYTRRDTAREHVRRWLRRMSQDRLACMGFPLSPAHATEMHIKFPPIDVDAVPPVALRTMVGNGTERSTYDLRVHSINQCLTLTRARAMTCILFEHVSSLSFEGPIRTRTHSHTRAASGMHVGTVGLLTLLILAFTERV